MPNNPVPTLSTFGYTNNVAEKVDFLLAHFCYSDKLQTTVYGNNVASLQWVIEEKIHSMVDTTELLSRTLRSYFDRYFDNSTINVDYELEDSKLSQSKVLLSLNITVVQDSIEYQVDRLLRVIDGKFKEFANINNG